jgi:hypothetical protein
MQPACGVAICLLSLFAAISAEPVRAEDCTGRTARIGGPSELRDVRYILRTRNGLFVFEGDCVRLDRDDFRGDIQFSIENDFATNDVGVVLAKSVRDFSVPTQKDKIKVSRGDGFLNKEGVPAKRLPDQPRHITIEQWDAAHANDATIETANTIIGDWHADSNSNGSLNSFDQKEFWRLDPAADYSHKTVTAYMVRFTGGSGELLDLFYVTRPTEVTRIEIDILSNFEALAGHFVFEID